MSLIGSTTAQMMAFCNNLSNPAVTDYNWSWRRCVSKQSMKQQTGKTSAQATDCARWHVCSHNVLASTAKPGFGRNIRLCFRCCWLPSTAQCATTSREASSRRNKVTNSCNRFKRWQTPGTRSCSCDPWASSGRRKPSWCPDRYHGNPSNTCSSGTGSRQPNTRPPGGLTRTGMNFLGLIRYLSSTSVVQVTPDDLLAAE